MPTSQRLVTPHPELRQDNRLCLVTNQGEEADRRIYRFNSMQKPQWPIRYVKRHLMAFSAEA
ncbi:hypothetical protein HJFPF1_13579 [Paramyrothecium foliicola]|nr:hypothetical protein HJFPF1_13579 [Paramyrothecium foliicola]